MESIRSLDQKIEKLKQKKQEIEQKEANALYQKSSQILGESFSSTLVLNILEDSWKKASHQQKEDWLKAAQKFQNQKKKPA